MNTETGEFVDARQAESWMKRVSVGEIIEIKGEKLRIIKFTGSGPNPRQVVLELLSALDREDIGNQYADLANRESERQMKELLKHQK